MTKLGASPRILITRLSAIGDCVHTLPLVSAIRAHYPHAYLGWVTQHGPASLLQGHAELDALIRVKRDWYKSWSSIRAVRSELRRHRFEVSIDPQSLTKSSLLGWLSGAKSRVGFSGPQGRELSPWLSTQRIKSQRSHVVHRYLELLAPIGISAPTVRFQLPPATNSDPMVDEFLSSHGLTQFALVNPGAGWDSKLWPHDNYADVVRHLHNQHDLKTVVLWAGDREREWAADIVNATDSALLAPATTLPQLATLCRRANLFVGSDTGPMHLAAAVDTPCVALFGPTKISVCGPYGSEHQPLQAFYQDGTSRERRGSDNRAMRAISVPQVCNACDRIVGNSEERLRVA